MYFTADFETGDYSQFTSSGGGTLEITTALKIQGSYGSKMYNNAHVRKDLSVEYPTLFCGAYFRWGGPPTGYYWYLLLGDGASTGQFVVMVWNGHLRLTNGSLESISTQTLSQNTWYFIEVQQYSESGHIRFRVMVDGVEWCTILGDFQGGDSGVRYIKWQGSNSNDVQAYIDNCVASDTQIDYGLKIVLSGYSILSQNPRHYAFWSRYASVKIAQIVTGTITCSGGEGYVEINHGLDFPPTVHIFTQLSSGKWMPGAIYLDEFDASDSDIGFNYVSTASSGGELVDTYIDATKVRLLVKGSGTINYVIIIFAESG